MKTSIESHRGHWRIVLTFPFASQLYGKLQPPITEYICPVAETLRIAELQDARLQTYRNAMIIAWYREDLDTFKGYVSAARAHAIYANELEQADAELYLRQTQLQPKD